MIACQTLDDQEAITAGAAGQGLAALEIRPQSAALDERPSFGLISVLSCHASEPADRAA